MFEKIQYKLHKIEIGHLWMLPNEGVSILTYVQIVHPVTTHAFFSPLNITNAKQSVSSGFFAGQLKSYFLV